MMTKFVYIICTLYKTYKNSYFLHTFKIKLWTKLHIKTKNNGSSNFVVIKKYFLWEIFRVCYYILYTQ